MHLNGDLGMVQVSPKSNRLNSNKQTREHRSRVLRELPQTMLALNGENAKYLLNLTTRIKFPLSIYLSRFISMTFGSEMKYILYSDLDIVSGV
jgi:hypothetical protein